MRKHKYAKIYAILMIVSLLLTFTNIMAYAEEQETEFMTLGNQANIIINIKYDTEIPIISFIAPDGTIYKEGDTPTDKMLVEYGDNRIYYQIPNAQAGTWKIKYDKLSNTTLDIDAVEYANSITIDDFTIESVDLENSYANVSFLVNYKDNNKYNYEISAVILDENKQENGSKLLLSGNATANEKKDVKVSLSSLATFDQYYLKLHVYTYDNIIEIFDYVYSSDSISYTNKNTPKAEGNIDIILDQTEGIMYLDWSKYLRYKKCYLTVYDSSSDTEPIYSNEFDSQYNSTQISTDIKADYIKVELRYESNGLYSDPIVKEIKLNDENSFNINIVTEELTNSYQAKIEYKNAKNQSIDIEVNEESSDMIIDGEGDFSVNLDEYYNTVKLSYNIDEYTKITISKDIYSDRVAPILKLYENKNEISVKTSQYIITGEIELDCILTIANNVVTVADDGTFSYEVQLNNGKNTFDIVVTDKAGNKTIHNLVINKNLSSASSSTDTSSTQSYGMSSYLVLIITFIISILIVVMLLFVKIKRPKFIIICWVMSIISTLTTIFMFAKRINISSTINSTQYFDIAKDSVEIANKLLYDYSFYKTASIYSLIATLIIVLITVIYKLITKNKKSEQ